MKPVEEVLEHITLPFPLHDYQKIDINNACMSDSYGLYLDPGLGKTAISTVISCYKLLHGAEVVIAVVPASIITQWVEWLEELGLVVCDYRGGPKTREKLDLDVDFIVLSPQIYQRDYDRFEIDGAYYIIDEATVMCNVENNLCKMLKGGVIKRKTFINLSNGGKMPVVREVQYSRRMYGCCLLTGTPINTPLDAYGLISITSPKAYSNYYNFTRLHVAAVNNFKQPVAFKELDKINKNMTENAVIREVSDHLDLPEKIYKIVRYDMSKNHLKLYRQLIEEQILELEDGSIIDATEATKMYHVCQQFIWCPVEFKGKIEGLEVLDTLVNATRRRLIFNKYRGANNLMMERYEAGGCFGDVSRANQTKYVKAFQSGDLDTLVANPKSGGVGLNLQICDQVIFSEIPVTQRDFKQAEMRCWRQGQTNPVVITLLVARGTIQETLLKNVMRKGELVDKVLHTKESLRDQLLGLI